MSSQVNEVLQDKGYIDVVLALVARGVGRIPSNVVIEVLDAEKRAGDLVEAGGGGLAEAWSTLGRVAALRDCQLLFISNTVPPTSSLPEA